MATTQLLAVIDEIPGNIYKLLTLEKKSVKIGIMYQYRLNENFVKNNLYISYLVVLFNQKVVLFKKFIFVNVVSVHNSPKFLTTLLQNLSKSFSSRYNVPPISNSKPASAYSNAL